MGKFTEKSRLKDLVACDQAKEVIEKYLPGALAQPGLKMALRINPSIKQAMGYKKQIGMDDETANKMLAELYAID